MNVLVTAGATREPIDAVRFVSNISTGATGAALADALQNRGHRVALLRGEGAVAPRDVADREGFGSAEDLRARLRRRLASGAWDVVIMVAAVADYRPVGTGEGKTDSTAPERTLQLVRNAKILPELKGFSRRPVRVVGFKLTVGAGEAARQAAVEALFAAGGVDEVVQNDLDEIRRDAVHSFRYYRARGAAPLACAGVEALADAII